MGSICSIGAKMFEFSGNDSNTVDAFNSQQSTSNNLNLDYVNAFNSPSRTSGLYKVVESGIVKTDFELDGGAYKTEVALISYKGLESFKPGSEAFNKEVAKRALSNSVFGHIITSERIEAGRLTGGKDNFSTGDYSGEKSFQMIANDQIFIAIAPNTTFQQIYENPDITAFYSLKEANPDGVAHIAKVNAGNAGITLGIEDIRQDSKSDRDFNDAVIKFQGIVGDAPGLKDLLNPNNSWWNSENGQKLLNENLNLTPPQPIPDPTPPSPPNPPLPPPVPPKPPLPPEPGYENGDLVKASGENIYLIESNSKRLIPNPGILREYDLEGKPIKTLASEELNKINSGDSLPIPTEYQESANVTNQWRSDFYWWNGNGTPSLDFSSNSTNKFATLNLGSNTGTGDKKGISFNWGAGSPRGDSKLLNDNFAIAAYTEATFDGGTYNFQASGDDGFQVFLKKKGTDDTKYLTSKDKWQQAYGSPWKTEATLQGNYEVYFIYYEERGDAKFDLSWEKKIVENPPQPPVKPHEYSFIYSFNGNRDASDYYKEGDYYTGWVVANPGKYVVGEEYDPNPDNNEAGKNGKYYILEDNGEVDASDLGKVFVANYHNSETLTNYQPFNFIQEKPSGTNFLGSEYDFIGSTKSNSNDFGLDKYKYDIQPRDIVVETISPSNGTVVRFDGRVDKFNVDDYYRFFIGSDRADFELKLNRLSANADVDIIFDRNRNGEIEVDEILSSSEQNANNSEQISRRLTSGTYYVRVYSTGGDTDYNLELSAKSVPIPKAINFIYNEMDKNKDSNDVAIMKGLNSASASSFNSLEKAALSLSLDPSLINNPIFFATTASSIGDFINSKLAAYVKWTTLVSPDLPLGSPKPIVNFPWDHKSDILNLNYEDFESNNGNSNDRGTVTLYSDINGQTQKLSYDIFSNIHYGYIGLFAGFGEDELLTGGGAAQIVSNLVKVVKQTFNQLNVPEDWIIQLINASNPDADVFDIPSFDDPRDSASIKLGFILKKEGLETLFADLKLTSKELEKLGSKYNFSGLERLLD